MAGPRLSLKRLGLVFPTAREGLQLPLKPLIA
jgi:hypothetical protein